MKALSKCPEQFIDKSMSTFNYISLRKVSGDPLLFVIQSDYLSELKRFSWSILRN